MIARILVLLAAAVLAMMSPIMAAVAHAAAPGDQGGTSVSQSDQDVLTMVMQSAMWEITAGGMASDGAGSCSGSTGVRCVRPPGSADGKLSRICPGWVPPQPGTTRKDGNQPDGRKSWPANWLWPKSRGPQLPMQSR